MPSPSDLYLHAERIQGLAEMAIPWCFKGALVLALAGAASWFLRSSSARARHLAWAVAVVAVMVLPAVQGLFPAISVPSPLGGDQATTAGSVLVLQPTPRPPSQTVDCSSEPAAAISRGASPAATSTDRPSTLDAGDGLPPRGGGRGSLTPLGTLALFGLWLVGAALVLLRSGPGWLRRRRLAAEAGAAPTPVARRLDELRRELGISRAVRCLTGAEAMPLTWGTLRPVVYLPRTASDWPDARLRHVLLHELAHVARCDALLFRLARLLCALRWFDPLAWYAAHRLRSEAEHACDERVLLADDRPALYAGHLLESLREARRSHPIAAIALGRRSQISARIEQILGRPRHRPTGRALALGAIGSLLLVGLVSSLTLADSPQAPELPAAPATAEWAWTASTPDTAASPEIAPAPSAAAPAEPTEPLPPEEPSPAAPAAVLAPTPAAPAAPPSPAVLATGSRRISVHESDDAKDDEGGFFDHSDYRGACKGGWLGGRTFGQRVEVRDDEWEIRIDHAGCRLDVTMEGDVRFELIDGGIRHLGREARLSIVESTDRGRRTLEATPDGSGVRYRYLVDGDRRPFDASGRDWLRRVTTELFRTTGVQADERVAAILAASGVDGLLEETTHIGSDVIHRRYLELLFAQVRPTDDETRRALEQAAAGIGSDFEMAELLIGLASRVDDPSAQGAYLRAADTVGSDFEARRVVEALVGAQRLRPRTLGAILDVAAGIGSDFEMAEALLAIQRAWPRDQSLDPQLFSAVETIGSDFEARRVLDAISDRELSAVEWGLLLEAAGDIGSDFEMAELLIRVARNTPGPLPRTFFEAVRTVGSDFEAQRALRAALEDQDLDEGELIQLLDAARSIGSDHELAELLVALARRYAVEGPVREAFLEASRTVGGSYERERVLLALGG